VGLQPPYCGIRRGSGFLRSLLDRLLLLSKALTAKSDCIPPSDRAYIDDWPSAMTRSMP
jgi:hypothetical protein